MSPQIPIYRNIFCCLHANNSDSDVDVQTEADGGQITIYSGRGLNIESTAGNIWLWVYPL